MLLEQYYLGCLSHASYLLADERSGNAVVVDPQRDIAGYLDDARRAGLRIVGVINTHLHADFVSGHLELAEATGAWIGFGARVQTDYPIRSLSHGDHISLGDVDLEVLETPGHTWESISILVRETPGDTPYAVLTGDSLFVGDVGRPDPAAVAAAGAEAYELARAQYGSIHRVLMALPDSVRVMPAHGAGSACGKSLSTETTSTIGDERLTNPSVQRMTEQEFVTRITSGQPAVPDYFAVDVALNRRLRPVLDPETPVEELTGPRLRDALARGARLLDTRDPETFAAGHLRGAVNVGLDGRFAETAGMVLRHGDQIVVITVDGRARESALRLARIGIDTVIGHLDATHGFPEELRDLIQAADRLSVQSFDQVRDGLTVLDVRNAGEREEGAVPGSLHIPLAELSRRQAEVPAGRGVVTYCAGGWRSSVAASLLRAYGHREVTDLRGGIAAWQTTSRPASGDAVHVLADR
jgi:glyoxylase-like metal-dependent hydrolase (beta-lactamase superfamily II)/rhodanese-related sulfurtransferase